MNVAPVVSVCVITYRQPAILERTLRDLFAQDYPADRMEIVVLDDGSGDQTVDLVQAAARTAPVSVQLILEQHKGDYFSGQRFNRCIQEANPQTDVFVHVEDAFLRPDLVRQ